MIIVILSAMGTVHIGNQLVLLLARRANRRMTMTMLLIMLLRITMVLIAAAGGGMAPCVGSHHASALGLLHFRGSFVKMVQDVLFKIRC